MSIVRVWRSDSPKLEAKKSLKAKQPKAGLKAQQKQPKKITDKPKTKAAPPIKANVPASKTFLERTSVVLQPTALQKVALGEMFDAPQALAELLRLNPEKIRSTGDASIFLLKNKRVLDRFINPRARAESIDLLTEMLIQWSEDPVDLIAIDFAEDYSISAQQEIYLPITGFRCLATSDPTELKAKRIGSQYEGPFTLFRENKSFVVTFNLVRRLTVSKVSNSPTLKPSHPNGTKLKNFVIPELVLRPGAPKPYISGLRIQKTEPQRRILYSRFSQVFGGGIKTMNWGDLSGWGVNGGLPSLGKRSR